jgi:hypothetical protein
MVFITTEKGYESLYFVVSWAVLEFVLDENLEILTGGGCADPWLEV